MICKGRPVRFNGAYIKCLTNDKIFVCDNLAGKTVHLEENQTTCLSKPIFTDYKIANNNSTSMSGKLLLKGINRSVYIRKAVERKTVALPHNFKFDSSGAAIVKFERNRPTEEHGKIVARCRHNSESSGERPQEFLERC